MVRSRVCFLLLFTLLLACKQKDNKDCIRLHQGIFHRTNPSDSQRVNIERSKFDQTEIYPGNTRNRIYWINWKSDCGCELVELNEKNMDGRDTIVFPMKKPEGILYNHRITQIKKDYYLYDLYEDGRKVAAGDTMWIDKLIGGFKSMGRLLN